MKRKNWCLLYSKFKLNLHILTPNILKGILTTRLNNVRMLLNICKYYILSFLCNFTWCCPCFYTYFIAQVLDDEAEVFMIKLWRLIIFESEAKRLGLSQASTSADGGSGMKTDRSTPGGSSSRTWDETMNAVCNINIWYWIVNKITASIACWCWRWHHKFFINLFVKSFSFYELRKL